MLKVEYKLVDPVGDEKYGKEYVVIQSDDKTIAYESCGAGWIKVGKSGNPNYISAFIQFDDGVKFNFTVLPNMYARDYKDPSHTMKAKLGEKWENIGGLWDFRRLGIGWLRGSMTLNKITYGIVIRQTGDVIGGKPNYTIFVEEDIDKDQLAEDCHVVENTPKQPPITKAETPENVQEFANTFSGKIEEDEEIPF